MKKSLKTNFVLTLIALFVAFVATATAMFTSTPVQAAKRSSVILSENFLSEELEADKWTLMTDGLEENKIGALIGGLNGTLNIGFGDVWNYTYTLYHDTYVDVKDTEDLVIEYSVLENNIDINGALTGIMLLKGLTDPSSLRATLNADAKLESITHGVAQRGHILTSMGYCQLFGTGTGVGNDDSGALGIGDSSRSQAVKNYYLEHYGNNLSYPKDDGRHSFGEDIFTTQLDSSVSGAMGILSQGYTFKHVYKASGGYECYAKVNGAEDSTYVLWASQSDTFGFSENDEKRYTARSGYVGFTAYGFGTSFELDFFNVYTTSGSAKTSVIEDSFDTSSQGERYDASIWKSTRPQEFTANLIYSEGGYLFDNPSETNYIYTPAVNKLKYDGLYDNYVVLETELAVRELTEGRDFGFLFNGTSHTHLLKKDGMIYVYLTYNEGDANYSVGVDYVAQGARVNIKTADSGIPVTTEKGDNVYKFNVYAKVNETITVEIKNIENQIVSINNFEAADYDLILKDRFGIYTAGTEGSAVVLMRKYEISNTYYYNFPIGESKSVSENFDGLDEEGNLLLNDGVTVWYGEGSQFVPDSGVKIENGTVHFNGTGHGSGITADYSYSSYEMYFDIVDMQREKVVDEHGTVITPISNSQIIIQFGSDTNILPNNSGHMFVITHKLTKPLTDPDIGNADADLESPTWVAVHGAGPRPIEGGRFRHNILDPELDGKTLRFKFTYKDSVATLGYVVVGEEDYSLLDQPIVTQYMEGGEGYVSINSTHEPTTAWCVNMTIDNFRVLDTNPLSTTPTAKPAEKPEVVPSTNNDNGGCGSTLSGAFGVGFALVGTGVAMTIARKRKSNKETTEENE